MRRHEFEFIPYVSHQPNPIRLLAGRMRVGLSTRRSVGGTSAATVIVGAPVVIGVVVRTIAVRVVVTTATAGVSSAGGVVMVSLAIGTGASHDDDVDGLLE